MTYDNWKTTNPADEFLGEVEGEDEEEIRHGVPVPRIPVSGAEAEDVIATREQAEACLQHCSSELRALLQNLNENLPADVAFHATAEAALDRLASIRGDIVGELMEAEWRLES